MQFRIVKYNYDTKKNDLLGYANIEDYNTAFKLFSFMKEHECDFCLEINTDDMADTEGDYYVVKGVNIVFPAVGGELVPHIKVEVEDAV